MTLGYTNGQANRTALGENNQKKEKVVHVVWQKARGKSKRNREGKREKGEEIERNEREL